MDPLFESLRVLVIDDEPFIRQLITRLLRDMPVKEVQIANDGDEGLKKLRVQGDRIDLVILDLEMPTLNGFQVLKALRAGDVGHSDLPVIILTGHGEQQAIQAAVQLGIHGYVVKPMSGETLAKNIKRALTKGRIPVEALGR
ncbi:MAG: response regulator [Alphaproteobacteria bacterium]|nr:response regulator [Alphaproteobacteria bacterium]